MSKKADKGDCMLNKEAVVLGACISTPCDTCGWSAAEARRRKERLRKNGLTLRRDGLMCLALGKLAEKKQRRKTEMIKSEDKKHCEFVQEK